MKDTQLLILGNGFDLECGLKSTFNDFESKQLEAMRKMDLDLSTGEPLPIVKTTGPNGDMLKGRQLEKQFWSRGLTIWDLILREDHIKRTWYDIEECIRNWIVDYVTPDGGIRNPYSSRGSSLTDFAYEALPFWHKSATDATLEYARQIYHWNGQGKDLLRILMQELHRFETAFAKYIVEQTKENPSYKRNARKLILKLTLDQFNQEPLNPANRYQMEQLWEQGTSILNFNYTSPLHQVKANPFVFNVHGKANEKNIIFGIDGTGVDTNLRLYREIVKFTKTYRLMALSSDPHTSLVQPYLAGSDQQEVTHYIKFFGHSLGEADYSYFQAIFDEVDLYESQTHLVFYYNAKRSNDKSDSGKNADEEMFEKVNHLISRYGETLDNKDHGKNLLHKLLLEGRLSVIQAPVS